jgi:hypothetical protein
MLLHIEAILPNVALLPTTKESSSNASLLAVLLGSGFKSYGCAGS